MNESLLIELGCEELPPKALNGIRDAFLANVCDGLEKSGLAFDRAASRAFSTPRRIALLLADVVPGQADQELERRGPAVSAAFDAEGNPTGAALGFARSVGKDVSELDRMKTDKGEWLYCLVRQEGKPLRDVLYGVLETAIRQLPVPKPMRWADNDFSFVRPVHWLVALHGEQIVEGELFGLEASDTTRGHRIHAPGPHRIEAATDYVQVLERAYVIADQDKRCERIRAALLETDENVIVDPDLLDEVNNLVEWPVPVACTFEEAFLEVPHAALVASMQDHQKFFPVGKKESGDEVTNRFVAISNIESQDTNQVRKGYERVIRPRLADARFFLEQDLKTPLFDHLESLDRVVFQQKIGTVGDKSRRIAAISRKIAENTGVNPEHCERAALLSKCDLVSHMVGEFPELQGQMGGHYALASGEPEEVARAIGEHYAPRFAGDAVPETGAGRIVSLADRADSLVGIFAAGLKPTGNKDPFALRRAALGFLRILLEADMDLAPSEILRFGAEGFNGVLDIDEGLVDDVQSFVSDRLRSFYTDRGYSTQLVNAVLSSPWTTLPDLDRRMLALDAFMSEEAARSLAASNKRIGNILRKSAFSGSVKIDVKLFTFDEEGALFESIAKAEEIVEPLLAAGRYEESLVALSTLEAPVNRFFDAVMVMDEDTALRENRLSLLSRLKGLFDRIADLSILG